MRPLIPLVASFGFMAMVNACEAPTQAELAAMEAEANGGKADSIGCSGDVPFDPVTGELVCPPYHRPAVFFSPHPDDESLAMAGAIAEHVAAGRDVFIELMTHGQGSFVHGMLDNGGSHGWHAGRHEYPLTDAEFGDARVREFIDASIRLGVTGVFVSEFGSDGGMTEAEVRSRVDWWLDGDHAGLSLKGTAREPSSRTSTSPHPDHAAVWDALINSGHADVRGYLVYKFFGTNAAYSHARDIAPWCADKVDALDAYRVWDPGQGRYAIGYHSVPDLFHASGSACREYVVIP